MGWTEEDQARFDRDCTAPNGAIWVCRACGRNGKRRDKIGDESCFLRAVLCVDNKPDNVLTYQWKWQAWNKAK